jgi:hypothetical protein
MWSKSGVFTCFCFCTLTLADAGSEVPEATVPRALVAEAVKAKINIHLAANERDSRHPALRAIVNEEIDEQSGEVLPSELTGTLQSIDIATGNRLLISFEDKTYVHEAVKIHLLGIVLGVKYLKAFPPLTDQGISDVRASIEKAEAAIEASLDAELIPLKIAGLDQRSIADATKLAFDALNREAGRPLTWLLAVPLADSDRDALAARGFNAYLLGQFTVLKRPPQKTHIGCFPARTR